MRRVLTMILAGVLSAGVFMSAHAVEQPAGYRMEDYDAPVPEEAPGAITISDETAYALWRTGRVVIIEELVFSSRYRCSRLSVSHSTMLAYAAVVASTDADA